MEKTLKPVITYNKKTIISGGVIEQFVYEEICSHGSRMPTYLKEKIKKAKIKAKKNIKTEAEKIKNRTSSMLRAKKTLTQLINSNVYQYFSTKGRPFPPIFLTLTFAKDIRNQKQANKQFSLFIKRLNYKVHKNKSYTLRYSVVVEFQDLTREGVIHYHVLLYDLQFIDVIILQSIWHEGGIDIHKVDDIDDIADYVTKYMKKNFHDERLDGHKRYFSSRGLFKPKTFAGDFVYDLIKNAIPKDTPKKEKTFRSEWKGKITKTTFTLEDKKILPDILDEEDIHKLQPYDIS
jgi:hypothetical protein